MQTDIKVTENAKSIKLKPEDENETRQCESSLSIRRMNLVIIIFHIQFGMKEETKVLVPPDCPPNPNQSLCEDKIL